MGTITISRDACLTLPYLNVDQACGIGFSGECKPQLQTRGCADVVVPEHEAPKTPARCHRFRECDGTAPPNLLTPNTPQKQPINTILPIAPRESLVVTRAFGG